MLSIEGSTEYLVVDADILAAIRVLSSSSTLLLDGDILRPANEFYRSVPCHIGRCVQMV